MDALDTISETLEGLLSDAPPAELQEFSKAEFLAYALEQVKKAREEAEDQPEMFKARFEHLKVNIDEVRKNGFEDGSRRSLPVFRGPLSVQAQTAWKERKERTISTSQALAAQQNGSGGTFTMKDKDGKVITSADLLAAFAEILGEQVPAEGFQKDDEGTGTGTGTGTGEDEGDGEGTGTGEGEGEGTGTGEGEGEGTGEGDGDKTETETEDAKKSADPWGSPMDMNVDANAEVDPDLDFGDSTLRVY